MTYKCFSVIISKNPTNIAYPKGYRKCKLEPIHTKDQKDTGQAVVSCGTPSSYVKELVKTSVSKNKFTSHNCLQLVSAVLDHGLQLK